jgi:hypothetical protein
MRRQKASEAEEPGEQPVSLLETGELLVVLHFVGTGQELAALEFDEDGGDDQEFGRDLEIERLAGGQIGQKGVHDVGQRDVVDVEFVVRDQLEQHVTRALVSRHRDVRDHVAQDTGFPDVRRAWPVSRVGGGVGDVPYDDDP